MQVCLTYRVGLNAAREAEDIVMKHDKNSVIPVDVNPPSGPLTFLEYLEKLEVARSKALVTRHC